MTTVAKPWHYLSERRTAETSDAPAPGSVRIKEGKRTADRLPKTPTCLGPTLHRQDR